MSIKQSDICRVADVCSNLPKIFHDYFLFNMFAQIVVGIVLSCLWYEKYKKHSFALQHDQYAVLLRRWVTQMTKKNSLNARQGSQHDCKIPQNFFESWEINCVFRLSLRLSTQIKEFEDKQAYKIFWDRSLSLKIKGHEVKSTNFLTLVAICLKINDGLVCLTASVFLHAK